MSPRLKNCVTIYLDGSPLHVTSLPVQNHYAVRGWIGLRRGEGVAYEESPTEILAFLSGHTFQEGERFVLHDGPKGDRQ